MNNPISRPHIAVLVGAALCSALVVGCGQDAAEESTGVTKTARNTTNSPKSPPPEALQAANSAAPK